MKQSNIIKAFVFSKLKNFSWIVMGLLITTSLLLSFTSNTSPDTQKLPLIALKVQKVGNNLEALTNVAFPGNEDMWVNHSWK